MNDLYGFVGDTSLIPELEYYGDCMLFSLKHSYESDTCKKWDERL